jgi:uncharacterized SAM-binding protein YcdF (DUF218 family)
MKERKPARGLLQRRECLLPTWRGWLVLLFAVAALVVFSIRGAYSFLAVNDPVDNGALVVEGWLPDYALQEAITEFGRGHHSRIFVTGGPLENGAPLSEYRTFAELGAATLLRLGLDTNAVQAVPAPRVRLDRTYASALALKNWLGSHGVVETNFNVISLGPHSRRSRLLFEKALGKDYKIGVIAIENQEYDAKQWWASSAGVRTMSDEIIAYLYARLSF